MDYAEIYVDPDITLNSLLKRIKSESEDKIVIIVHQKSPIFTGQINIELIKKYAQKSEKELFFITDIKKIRNLLSNSGFKVFSELEQFESKEEVSTTEVQKQNFTIPSSKSKRGIAKKLGAVLFVILLLGFTWIYFLLPMVTVEISPAIEEKTIVSEIVGRVGANNINVDAKQLPLVKKEAVLNKTIRVKTTGKKKIGVSRAEGTVVLINNQQQRVNVPKGALVATGAGIRFRISEDTVVPAAEINKFMGKVVEKKAGRAEVKIKAVKKGEAGNVREGEITNWASKSYPVEIINPEPVVGGESKVINVATEDDINRGLGKAEKTLLEQVRKELAGKFSPDMIYFKDKLNFTNKVLEPMTKQGERSEEVEIKAKIKAIGFAVKKEGLKDLVFKLYKRELKDDYELLNSQITIKGIEIREAEAENLLLNVKSRGKIAGKINKEEIVKQIMGKKVEAAKKLLDQIPGIESYQIKPANQVNLPDFKFGVDLVVKKSTEE